MRALIVSLCGLLLLIPTIKKEKSIEVRHGTVLLYEETATQVIIAADSKLFPGDMSGCKIVELSDDTVFFYTGNLFMAVEEKTGKEFFSQEKIASQAYSSVKNEPRSDQRLIDVANKYSALIRPKMNELFKRAWSHDFSEAVGLAGFASLDESRRPRVVLANISLIPPKSSGQPYTAGASTISEPNLDAVNMGNYPPYKAVNEFLDAKTQRAKKAMQRFNSVVPKLPQKDVEAHRLIAAIQASLDWNKDDPTIGPPIDAVVIEPGSGSGTGIRWIRRKSNCRENRVKSRAFVVTPR